MKIELKHSLYNAINAAIMDYSEVPLWDGLIDEDLISKMTDAAALVFDASMAGQAFANKELP